MPIIVTPVPHPIIATAITLPPMGRFVYSCNYTSKKNSGNIGHTFNPTGYTPSAQSERDPSFGVYTKYQMAIDIPFSILGGLQPKPADFFEGPDGEIYNVLTWQTRSLFFCRVVGFCPILSYDLTSMVQYIRVTSDSSSTTAREITETPTGDPQPGAIQPQLRVVADEFGTKATPQTYRIWLQTGLGEAINAGDMLQHVDGDKYEILQVEDRNLLDALDSYLCVKKL